MRLRFCLKSNYVCAIHFSHIHARIVARNKANKAPARPVLGQKMIHRDVAATRIHKLIRTMANCERIPPPHTTCITATK